MNMEIIQSVVSETLVNLMLAVITLAGTYAIYYIRLGASKLQAQTAQIADEKARQLLNNAVIWVTSIGASFTAAVRYRRIQCSRAAGWDRPALQSDLPLVYTLREDFIRSMNSVDHNISGLDQKLDRVLNLTTASLR